MKLLNNNDNVEIISTDKYLRDHIGVLHHIGDQPVVYIIGALRNQDPAKQRRNIDIAMYVAAKYWNAGFAVICPHLNGGCYENILSRELLLIGHKRLLALADLVVVIHNFGLIGSEGSAEEIALARQLNKEIVYEKWECNPLDSPDSHDFTEP